MHLVYPLNIFVPRKTLLELLRLADDSKRAGKFGLKKTLRRLNNYYEKHQIIYVKEYLAWHDVPEIEEPYRKASK